tara:strand:+ start:1963 stop:2919 length:957 start_codon:yes stop_codon:yes gene_type:complete
LPIQDFVSITDHLKEYSIESRILGDYLIPNLSDKTTILLVWHKIINSDFLQKYPNIRAIVRYGVGVDNIDLEKCRELGINVYNTPDYGVDEVSDTAISMALSLARRVKQLEIFAIKNRDAWTGAKIPFSMKRINNMNIGIIGLGRIGGAFARKMKVFSSKISFFDPYIPSGIEKTFNIRRFDNLNDLLENSDIVSVHTPLNNQTKGVINKDFINKMKKGSILINVSRGPIVKDNKYILKALQNNSLSGYGTDVFVDEPPNLNDELYQLWLKKDQITEKVIINPHTSYFSEEAIKECREKATLNVLNIIKDKNVKNKII